MGGLSAQEAADYYRGELGGADHLYAGDRGFALAERYEVRELGTTVIIDRRGVISFRDAGVTDPDVLKEEIQRALN